MFAFGSCGFRPVGRPENKELGVASVRMKHVIADVLVNTHLCGIRRSVVTMLLLVVTMTLFFDAEDNELVFVATRDGLWVSTTTLPTFTWCVCVCALLSRS